MRRQRPESRLDVVFGAGPQFAQLKPECTRRRLQFLGRVRRGRVD
jgi:hypothetical protein